MSEAGRAYWSGFASYEADDAVEDHRPRQRIDLVDLAQQQIHHLGGVLLGQRLGGGVLHDGVFVGQRVLQEVEVGLAAEGPEGPDDAGAGQGLAVVERAQRVVILDGAQVAEGLDSGQHHVVVLVVEARGDPAGEFMGRQLRQHVDGELAHVVMGIVDGGNERLYRRGADLDEHLAGEVTHGDVVAGDIGHDQRGGLFGSQRLEQARGLLPHTGIFVGQEPAGGLREGSLVRFHAQCIEHSQTLERVGVLYARYKRFVGHVFFVG